jgi:hypothetical protein
MFELVNPKATATISQKVFIHHLTGINTTNWKLSMATAQKAISELKANGETRIGGKTYTTK